MTLTLVSFGTRAGHWHDGVPLFALVIVAAMIKVRFVVLDFMEVRRAPWALRLVLEAWIVGLASVLIVTFD
jgi:Prokaryotic Cytochrome C oxidase subunit IV